MMGATATRAAVEIAPVDIDRKTMEAVFCIPAQYGERAGENDFVIRLSKSGAHATASGAFDDGPRPLRVAASSKSLAADRTELLTTRTALMQKRFSESGLSPRGAKRLRYVEWRLDAIESLQSSRSMDQLEALVERQERFANLMTDMAQEVECMREARRRRPPR